MFESHKKMFEQHADLIVPGWRKINKNQLINKYIENETSNKELAGGYISAILCKYWGAISKYYLKSHSSVGVETCYDWLIRSIFYAIKRRPWVDPNNKLYGDPNGPDKVVNQVIKSTRLGFYQSSNTHKRKCNYGNASLEAMVEEMGEAAPLPEDYSYKSFPVNVDLQNLIRSAFNSKEYLLAFMVDGIINYEVFDYWTDSKGRSYSQFSGKRLAKHVRSLSPKYCERFAQMYNLPEKETERAALAVHQTPRNKLKIMMARNMKILARTQGIAGE